MGDRLPTQAKLIKMFSMMSDKLKLYTLLLLGSAFYTTIAPVQSLTLDSKLPSHMQQINLHRLIEDAAAHYDGISAALIAAVMSTESNFEVCALSNAGAQGLMQLMPKTAADLNVSDSYDPIEGVRGGAAYLSKGYKLTGDIYWSVAFYHAGYQVLGSSWEDLPPNTQRHIWRFWKKWPKFQSNWKRHTRKIVERKNKWQCEYANG